MQNSFDLDLSCLMQVGNVNNKEALILSMVILLPMKYILDIQHGATYKRPFVITYEYSERHRSIHMIITLIYNLVNYQIVYNLK